MAIDPLYIDKTLLLQRLRMASTEDTETLTVIDQAIQDVRNEFYRRLGLARALEIQALSSVENPTTEDEVLRSVADITDFYWVLYKLVCILPHMFIETQFAIRNSFDDTPLTRDADSLSQFKPCLLNSIEQNLGLLIVPVDTNSGDFSSFSTGRTSPYLLHQNFIGLR